MNYRFIIKRPLYCLQLVSAMSWFKQRENTDTESYHDDKTRYLSMSLRDKRKQYNCGHNYSTLSDIQTWGQFARTRPQRPEFRVNHELNEKVSIFVGDITAIEVDAIVNAADNELTGGGGVDAVIHNAAGKHMLRLECRTLNSCPTGTSKITGGYKLPAKYIIHTVGPKGQQPDQLRDAYQSALDLMSERQLKSIAFPCISTGVYGYPNEEAANVALRTVRLWLESSPHSIHIERVVFCLFGEKDREIYNRLMPVYFPYNSSENDQAKRAVHNMSLL
ncbi:unnamed protein product [Medioppia subpectinata]|uniref:Macro domain-containing protein n=1 Tax=Medioppia subpectinata TaxID=1979941 RepID=A0A7R9KJL2_9ACAR|nr:unnamed protein product [Medioppia subpectinata]CAG2104596.1 unnamed protein product [Medioppia subpectinata]